MKITVNEAMRLKNEISKAIQQTQCTGVSYGQLWDGSSVVSEDESNSFPTFIARIKKLFAFSEEVNSKLSNFNIQSGVSDAVRSKANIDYLIAMYQGALPQSIEREHNRYEVVGNSRVQIKQTFRPFSNKADIKTAIKALKEIKRKILEQIDTANTTMIDLTFEMADFEECVTE